MRSILILLTALQLAAMSLLAVAKPPKTADRTPFDEYVQQYDKLLSPQFLGSQPRPYGQTPEFFPYDLCQLPNFEILEHR